MTIEELTEKIRQIIRDTVYCSGGEYPYPYDTHDEGDAAKEIVNFVLDNFSVIFPNVEEETANAN